MRGISRSWVLFFVALIVLSVDSIAELLLGATGLAWWLAVGWAGVLSVYMLVDMIRDIRRGSYGVDAVALVAIWAAVIAGEYVAATVVMVMWTGGEALEAYANRRAKRELTKLMDRRPGVAHVVRGGVGTDAGGEVEAEEDVAVARVKVGEVVRVKTGEMVPMDGVLLLPRVSLDTSSITGEALPVEVGVGGRVISGSVNIGEAFTMKVSALADDSEYGQILKLVREIETRPADFVRMADRYAVPFTLVVFVVAGLAWGLSGDFMRLAQVLVVASPCPLILAAPAAFMMGMSVASKNGIIVKNGVALEKLAGVRGVAFDKTGTLSEGEVAVSSVVGFAGSGYSPARVLAVVASAEVGASHILARSVVKYAEEQGVKIAAAERVSADEGMGVDAVVAGKKVIIGSVEHMRSHRVGMGLVPKNLEGGKSAILLAVNGKAVGMVTFADVVRRDAAGVVRKLKKMGVEDAVMVTGDKMEAASGVAEQVGIEDGRVFAGCLPRDKVKIVEREVARPVMFVGDGVNDAPVLAAADVGVAMGAYGATAASESADVVVMADNLSKVPVAVRLAKRTVRIGRQSTLIGIGISVGLCVVAGFGVIPVMVGAVLQEVLDVGCVLNALRVRR